MTTDLKIIKPSLGMDVYHWEDPGDVLPVLKSLKFQKGHKAILRVDYNGGMYFTKGDLIKAWRAFTEK